MRLARRGTALLDAVEQRVEVLLEGRDEAVPCPGGRRARKRVTTMTRTLNSTLTSASAAGWSTRPCVRALPRPALGDPGRLKEGMRTRCCRAASACRPLVIIAACEAVGGTAAAALPACCALEMIHAYSLVHDDLPAMDNDLERRGQPTVHVAFGHADGILVGDALLSQAFAGV